MNADERRSESNAIWLCANCSILVDRDQQRFSAETLQAWKATAEERARLELGTRLPGDRDAIDQVVTALTGQPRRFIPHAISNVHRAAQRVLEDLDPRFEIQSEHSHGATRFTVSAREDVQITARVSPESAPAWTEGFRELIDHGRPATLPMKGVSLEGSKLFQQVAEDAQLGSVTVTPIGKDAAITFSARSSGDEGGLSELFPGTITRGRSSVRFAGGGLGGLVSIEMQIVQTGDGRLRGNLTLGISLAQWAGVDVRSVPYLDRVLTFLKALVYRLDQVRVSVEIEGNEVVHGVSPGMPDDDSMAANLSFANYVRCARTVARACDVPISIDIERPFTAQDHEKLAEAAAVFGGKKRFSDRELETSPSFTLTVEGEVDQVIAMAESQEHRALLIAEPPETLRVFNQPIQLPSRKFILEAVLLKIRGRRNENGCTQLDLATEMKPGSHVALTYEDIPINPPPSAI